jgi:two-component system sensor histidine kinase/response regulator
MLSQSTSGQGQSKAAQPERGTPANGPAKPVRPLNVLLAEDNAINQRVAERMLHMAGHHVTVASNGKLALAAFEEQGDFDAVLMDVQMPEMDGLETTAAIRMLEEPTGRHLPIIAMTAHGLQGDRERCLAAGMDGYISKPVSGRDLRNLLAVIRPFASAEESFDRAAVFRRTDSDLDFLEELASMMEDIAPRLVAEIHDAIEQNDAAKLQRTAHSLKGSLIPFVAAVASDAAQSLETMGHVGDLSNASQAYLLLDVDVRRLLAALKEVTSPETVTARG